MIEQVTTIPDSASAWWQKGVIYQIYPRSFQDSDGDGTGDINGIVSRLSHLVELGVDAIWLSPIFSSPMADFGYDVADYCGVDPMFGTMEDFDRLLSTAHGVGLKVILDFVPNHTSDQHPWFVESRSSQTNSKRDWYIWRDRKPDGGPPNNWLSEFGGPAWTLDQRTGQYYYHAYLSQQPDLNWRNPDVRAAMLDVLRFWLARGVDGFRVDAIHHLFEDEELRDNPLNPDWREGMSPARRLIRLRTADQPEVHGPIAAMRRVADEYDSRLLIGEAYLPIDRLMAYYGMNLTGFHLPFNFHLISTPWESAAVAGLIDAYERALPPGGWPNWVLGNHDRSRVASRLGRDQARVAAMLLLTCAGPLPFTRVRSWVCKTSRSCPSWSGILGRRTCRDLASAATPCGRRCPGHARQMADSAAVSPGCRSISRERWMSLDNAPILPQCFLSIEACCGFAALSWRSPSGPITAWRTPTQFWFISGGTVTGRCRSR
jgi:alpha-glucosidase